MRRVFTTAPAVAAVLAAAACADAGAAARVVDVPGVSGRSLSIAAAARLADGGAIVAGTLTPSGSRRARPRLVVMRLRHDGLVDMSFGDGGAVRVQLARGDASSGSRATAVAVDPARGRSWIAAAIGSQHTGAVLALDGRGRRVRGFGSNAVVRLAGDATAPAAIAFGNGRLALAAGRQPCRGCQLLLLDPRTGRRTQQAAVAPVAGAGAAPCPSARVTSLALVGSDRLVVAGAGGGGGDGACPARLVIRDGSLNAVAEWEPGDAGTTTVVAAAGAPLDLCASVERAGAAGIVRVAAGLAGPAPATLPVPASRPVAGTIAGVVALGAEGCGALLLRDGAAARVLQTSGTAAAPSVVPLPASLRAGAIYRCRRHVLVVGTRRSGGIVRASVAVTAIVRR